MMLLFFRNVLVVSAALVLCGCASSSDVHFAAIGDTPYFESDTELENVSFALNKMADRDIYFVVHVGDIIRGRTKCTESLYKKRGDVFSKSTIPFIITIGDNEFNDCKHPLKARERFRKVILGNLALKQEVTGLSENSESVFITRQDNMIENASWRIGGITFVLLVLPDMPGTYPLSQSDADYIIESNIKFLTDNFAQAKKENNNAFVLIMHSNPATCAVESCYKFLNIIKDEVRKFAKPVLLINGSNHDKEHIASNYFDISNLSHLRPGNEPEVVWPEVWFSNEINKFQIKWHYEVDEL